ncbi:glycosyltransferase family 2 protein [Marinilabiliaceae bacterium JC017]|nr:glycosyltransferase family 2 protein [Marinilabiliaceae bacterium JC017]
MRNNNRLAIVIPAYKEMFLDEAIGSIAKQTCRDFKLYVGDDCSPYEIKSIVNKYTNIINIEYKRFDSNLGGKDLVAQWERCIDMANNEEWIWLFSDDDIMEPNCVEEFYRFASRNSDADIFHFNVKIIDQYNNEYVNASNLTFPDKISSIDFYKKRMCGDLNSYVVEYIFKRDTFYNVNRFESFDLAWGSDVATTLKLSLKKGYITTCMKCNVKWRRSNENISPNVKGDFPLRKLTAVVKFLLWSESVLKTGNNITFFNFKMLLSRILQFSPHIKNGELLKILKQYFENKINVPVIKGVFIWSVILSCRVLNWFKNRAK